jgi:hypothetical protein
MTKARLASALMAVVLVASAFSFLSAFWAAPARASLVVALDTPALVQRADHIAVADVVSVRSAWDDRHEKIFTTIELSVVESWKGGAAPASRITVVQPGGTVDDIAMVVFGLSQFTPGERTLVFLRGKTAAAGVVGMAQGKRPMRRDSSSGQWMVDVPDRSGLQLVAPSAVRPTPGAQDSSSNSNSSAITNRTIESHADRARPLDELRGQVRDLLKAKR